MSRLDQEVPDNEEASIKVSLLPMKLNIDQVRGGLSCYPQRDLCDFYF